MLQDEWEETISFLEPMDVVCSLNRVCHDLHQFSQQCQVTSTGKMNYGIGCDERSDSFSVMKHPKRSIQLYTKQLAEKIMEYGTVDNRAFTIVKEHEKFSHQLDLFRSYRTMLSEMHHIPSSTEEETATINNTPEETVTISQNSIFSWIKSFFFTPKTQVVEKMEQSEEKRSPSCLLLGSNRSEVFYFKTITSGHPISRSTKICATEFMTWINIPFSNGRLIIWDPQPYCYNHSFGFSKIMKRSNVAMLCFSVSNSESLVKCRTNYELVASKKCVLVGLIEEDHVERQVKREEGVALARELDTVYFEVNLCEMNNLFLPPLYLYLIHTLTKD